MKYTGQLKESLIQNFRGKSLTFKLVFSELIIGLILALAITGLSKPFFIKDTVFISIFAGFISSYFLFADTVFYLFKHIKNLSILKVNFIIIKDLLIVFLFFIIFNILFKINFVFAAIGITIMPVSLIIFLLLSAVLSD
ncbi:MAG: hypothetical protein ACYDDB_05490 [bacterium]